MLENLAEEQVRVSFLDQREAVCSIIPVMVFYQERLTLMIRGNRFRDARIDRPLGILRMAKVEARKCPLQGREDRGGQSVRSRL